MKNILATSCETKRRIPINLTAAALGLSMIASTLWGVWATDKLLALEKREVVTVQLSRIMGLDLRLSTIARVASTGFQPRPRMRITWG